MAKQTKQTTTDDGGWGKLARDIVENDFIDMGGERLKWIERFTITHCYKIFGS